MRREPLKILDSIVYKEIFVGSWCKVRGQNELILFEGQEKKNGVVEAEERKRSYRRKILG